MRVLRETERSSRRRYQMVSEMRILGMQGPCTVGQVLSEV
jgi:hypothetical protein